MNKYSVQKIKNCLEKNTIIPWEQAIVLKDFKHPWLDEVAKETCFRALHDENFLYVQFDVKDTNIFIYAKGGDKEEVAQSDRVELFFRKNKQLETYYCLEIDPKGRVLDYAASYYRKFKNTWTWPKGHLFIITEVKEDGYCVEIKISLTSLRKLGLLSDNKIQTGIYRADCIALPNKGEKESTIKWISWVDPKTPYPDFHIPSSFGILELMSD